MRRCLLGSVCKDLDATSEIMATLAVGEMEKLAVEKLRVMMAAELGCDESVGNLEYSGAPKPHPLFPNLPSSKHQSFSICWQKLFTNKRQTEG